jgi:hypothetical protein
VLHATKSQGAGGVVRRLTTVAFIEVKEKIWGFLITLAGRRPIANR